MFHNLASYLLGAVTNSDQAGATAVGDEEQNNHRTSRLISRLSEDENDWVLVDRHQDSEGNSDASSVESFDIGLDDATSIEPSAPTIVQLTRTSSVSSLPCTSTMEESWFLTPPPCFTSTGPIHMETSPLENLLIEHPSMSVYQHPHHRRHVSVLGGGRGGGAEPAREEDELEVEDVRDENGEEVVVVRRVPPHRYGVQVMQLQEIQGIRNKQAQKVQIQKSSQPLKRGYLERTNKAREVNCRNRRQRRGERSQGAQRSHANNNRKC